MGEAIEQRLFGYPWDRQAIRQQLAPVRETLLAEDGFDGVEADAFRAGFDDGVAYLLTRAEVAVGDLLPDPEEDG